MVTSLATTFPSGDFVVELRDLDTQAIIYTGSLTDLDPVAKPGVFLAALQPTLAGKFAMYLQFKGLDVDSSPYEVVVEPSHQTLASLSTVTGLPMRLQYVTG